MFTKMFWSYLTIGKQELCQSMQAFESPVKLKRLHLIDVQWDKVHDAWDCRSFIPPLKKSVKALAFHFIWEHKTDTVWECQYVAVDLWLEENMEGW